MKRIDRASSKTHFFRILKITFVVLYLGITLLFGTIYSRAFFGEGAKQAADLIAFIILVLVLGSIGYAITLIPAVIGLISCIATKDSSKNFVFFLIATLLPIATEITWILLVKLI